MGYYSDLQVTVSTRDGVATVTVAWLVTLPQEQALAYAEGLGQADAYAGIAAALP